MTKQARANAPIFAALGDDTRLLLVGRLSQGRPCSITQLTEGSKLSRQAITKHLRSLEDAGLVRCRRAGREQLFELDPRPLTEVQAYLQSLSQRWDEALERLRAFVEE